MGTPSADNLLLGQGQLFFDRFDMSSGIPIPSNYFRHLGNCSAFTMTMNNEKVEKWTSMYAAKRLYKQVIRQTKAQGKITMDEYDPDNLALVMLGEKLDFTRAAVNRTGANAYVFPYAVVAQDRYMTLPDRKITAASVVVKDNGAGTPFIIDADYQVDAEHGRIYVVPGGDITPGTVLKVEYTGAVLTAADKIQKIIGANKPTIEGRLTFVGDPTTGPTYYAEFWHVMISPEGELGLISNDFASFGLNFMCFDKRTQHPGEPYYRVIQVR